MKIDFPPTSSIHDRVLGIPINVINFDEAQDRILEWACAYESRYVIHANVHVIVTATRDPSFNDVLNRADLVTPDGAPVAWMLRRLGHSNQDRISGPDLTWALLARCEKDGLAVYFYGSSCKTLELLAKRIHEDFPALVVAGYESPPFRMMTAAEDADTVVRINNSGAALVFVGLGCPKQEKWMHAHHGSINAVMLGVGAAFDFHAGTISRAPVWMRSLGMEWLYRLCSEPRRLWRRYFITNTAFIFGAAKQLLLKWKLGN